MPVKAVLEISLSVKCPHCEECFDLLEDTDLNEEGLLLDKVCPSNGNAWTVEHDLFYECVKCPSCNEEFEVKGVKWNENINVVANL